MIGPLSVAGALALPVLRRALPQVLAGEENLNRAVRWVHVVDVPEPEELLRGGELVLSTGLGPGHDQVAQRRFIRSLDDQQAAGLLIEIGYTYKQDLPRALVAEAAARSLPLIATHRPTRFVDITEAIHGALVDRRLRMLRRAQDAGDRMTSIVLERGDPDALLIELARSLQNPVALENIAGQLVAFAAFRSGEQELLEAHLEYVRAREPGQLEGPGWLASVMNDNGFEIRHEENLREHYSKTLKGWCDNLDAHWDEAVAEVGQGTARVWKLYMAGCILGFDRNVVQLHQILGVKLHKDGSSGMPLRPNWEPAVERAKAAAAQG